MTEAATEKVAMSPTDIAVHTPRYVVRRRAVLDAIRKLPRGRFLEVGCGRGEMLTMFYENGFTGFALEISETMIDRARETVEPLYPDIKVVQSLDELPETGFDYLFCFEVLEHIENDHDELARWLKHLSPHGQVVISVPSRMDLWSASDEAVGHVRRYERQELVDLLEGVGLEVLDLNTFGYPLVLLTRPLRNIQHRIRRDTGQTAHEKTLVSATDSTLSVPSPMRSVFRHLINFVATIFYYLGLPLRKTDLGDGYVVVARRRQ